MQHPCPSYVYSLPFFTARAPLPCTETFLRPRSFFLSPYFMAAAAETKKIVNPRVEIDTSPPFESVKEAVDHFGGSGPWIPYHLLRLANVHHASDGFDSEKMEKQAMELERDLIMKQQQTLNVFKQLQETKRLVDSSCMSPGFMFVELNQAKLNLEKTSIDLAEIQASVKSLNDRLRKDKHMWFSREASISKKTEDSTPLSRRVKCDFEAEQLKNMSEGSRYEVMKAMAEIERTKNSIKMAEMRLNAAKKMEEAAKAVEAIAIAESERNKTHLEDPSSDVCAYNRDGITLSLEEYKTLVQKADQDHPEEAVLEKFEETIKEHKEGNGNSFSKFMFRNSHKDPVSESCVTKEMSNAGSRSTATLGQVLGRKFIGQNEMKDSVRGHVCLSQMLSEQSEIILHPSPTRKTREDGSIERQHSVRKKKFGFIKKKTLPLSVR